ncbi:hypothetical protein GCM10027194_03530 [Thalassiella azotivora]
MISEEVRVLLRERPVRLHDTVDSKAGYKPSLQLNPVPLVTHTLNVPAQSSLVTRRRTQRARDSVRTESAIFFRASQPDHRQPQPEQAH